jgi:hypothetical protein
MSSMMFEGEVGSCETVSDVVLCGGKEEATVRDDGEDFPMSQVMARLCYILLGLEWMRVLLIGRDGKIGKRLIYN